MQHIKSIGELLAYLQSQDIKVTASPFLFYKSKIYLILIVDDVGKLLSLIEDRKDLFAITCSRRLAIGVPRSILSFLPELGNTKDLMDLDREQIVNGYIDKELVVEEDFTQPFEEQTSVIWNAIKNL